ncbi:MAG: hypothetical protein JSV86_16160 [Gemmatimonadota bacterium]|nr:MAG: hypothetical protein JSV86_16160 [Gemmatimonadota bacterium]
MPSDAGADLRVCGLARFTRIVLPCDAGGDLRVCGLARFTRIVLRCAAGAARCVRAVVRTVRAREGELEPLDCELTRTTRSRLGLLFVALVFDF